MTFIEDKKAFFECNCCGQRHYLQADFGSTWSALKASGWRAFKDFDGWMHECAECKAERIAGQPANILDRPMRVVK